MHQYALRARDARWDVIEATSIDALDQLTNYVGLNKSVGTSVSLSPSVSVVGMASASLGEVGTRRESENPLSLLSNRLCERLRKLRLRRGLVLIIDEVQKIEQEHMVRICNAVQLAKTSGLDIALVLGGLPLAYPRIRSFKDCTFVRRMARQLLWCMSVSETIGFLSESFARVPELGLTSEQVFELGRFSGGGHPYLMQLVGDQTYRVVRDAYEPVAGTTMPVEQSLIEEAKSRSLVAYKEDVLNDVLVGAHPRTREYVRLVFELRDSEDRPHESRRR